MVISLFMIRNKIRINIVYTILSFVFLLGSLTTYTSRIRNHITFFTKKTRQSPLYSLWVTLRHGSTKTKWTKYPLVDDFKTGLFLFFFLLFRTKSYFAYVLLTSAPPWNTKLPRRVERGSSCLLPRWGTRRKRNWIISSNIFLPLLPPKWIYRTIFNARDRSLTITLFTCAGRGVHGIAVWFYYHSRHCAAESNIFSAVLLRQVVVCTHVPSHGAFCCRVQRWRLKALLPVRSARKCKSRNAFIWREYLALGST